MVRNNDINNKNNNPNNAMTGYEKPMTEKSAFELSLIGKKLV